MSSGLISPADYHASRGNSANNTGHITGSSQQKSNWPQGYAKGPGRFQSQSFHAVNKKFLAVREIFETQNNSEISIIRHFIGGFILDWCVIRL